ncbi:DMT family transporter [Sulfurifustis variabilis]|nr:DMT family transporter [Sulfurifustis variabilis]
MASNRRMHLLPVASLLLGAGLWGVIWYPMRLLEGHGLSGIWLTLILYAAALAASLPVTLPAARELVAHRRTLLPLALAGGWTNIAFVLAILDGNVMRVLLLFYLSPVWAVILGWIILGERVSNRSLATLGVAMAGALLLLWDPVSGVPWPQHNSDWLALSAGFAFALSNVFVRKGQEASIAAKSLAVWVGVAVIAYALIALFRVPSPGVEATVTLGAVALGVFGILLMTVLVQYGVTHMPIHRSAVILLFELVSGAISQQLLTDEVMTAADWSGGALIIVAAYISARL